MISMLPVDPACSSTGSALYHRPIVIACKSLNDVGALEEYKGVKCVPRKFTPSKIVSNAIFG